MKFIEKVKLCNRAMKVFIRFPIFAAVILSSSGAALVSASVPGTSSWLTNRVTYEDEVEIEFETVTFAGAVSLSRGNINILGRANMTTFNTNNECNFLIMRQYVSLMVIVLM